MAAPVRYLSGRQQQQKIGIEGSTQNEKVLEVIGRVGIGTTIFEPSKQLDVRGDVIVSGELTVGDTTFGADTSTRNLSVSGVSTFTGAIDANGSLDVDGHTELDNLNVSGFSTFSNHVTLTDNKHLQIGDSDDLELYHNGITGESVISESGGGNLLIAGTNLHLQSTIGEDYFVGTANGSVKLYYDDAKKFETSGIGVTVTGQLDATDLNISGVSTFTGAIDANGDLDVDGHTELDDVNVSGASTFTGAIDANGSLDVDGHTELDDVNVSGASTFTGAADFNGDIDVDGHTELDDVNVSGASTFTGAADFNGDIDVDGHTELDNLNVSGVSTFVGVATFSTNDVYVAQRLFVGGVEVGGDTNTFAGINTFTDTTDNTLGDSNTGAVQINGGLGVDKNVSVGAGLSVGQGITVAGLSTFVGLSTFTSGDVHIAQRLFVGGLEVEGGAGENVFSGISTFTNQTDNVLGNSDTGATHFNGGIGIDKNATVGAGLSVVAGFEVGGVSTFTGNIDANGNLDVDGQTDLDVLNVAELATFTGNIDANGDLDVDGHTELDNVNASGISSATAFANFDYLQAPFGSTVTFTVTVASKDATHRYNGTGSGSGYLINGVQAPFLTLTPGRTYRFTNDNTGSHPLKFYLEADKTTEYTSGVSFQSTYTEITVSDETPTVLHYQCTAHGYMGNAVQTNSNVVNTNYAATLRDSLTVSGNINANGNIVGDSATNITGIAGVTASTLSGTLQTAAQTNITSVGTLTGLEVNGHSELDGVNVSTALTAASLNVTDKLTTTGIGISVANSGLRTAYIEGPEEIWIDPHPAGAGATSGSVRIRGDLYVDGTEFIVDVDKIELGDFNIGIASTVPTNTLLDGAGLGIGAESIRKTITWNNATSALMSSENWNLASGKHYEIAGTDVLTSTTLGSGVVNSSLTNLGTLTALDVNGHTELDNLNVSGIATFGSNATINSLITTNVATLQGGFNASGNSSIVGDLTLQDLDAGSAAGPELKLYRNSSSPADADYLGQIKFAGESDTGVERNYAKITGKILDASNGTEDGIIEFAHIKAGSQTITGRFRSDSLQLLNGTALSVDGDITATSDINANGNIVGDNSTNITGINQVTATTFVGALTGTATTATNIAGGDTGDIPYQSANGTTTFVDASGAGTNQVLLWSGSAPVWANVSAGAGALTGISVQEEGSAVGTANSITTLNFVGDNITATASGSDTAIITLSGTPTFSSLKVTGISTIPSVTGPTTFTGGDVNVGTAVTIDPTSGIISATAFYGSGENLTDLINQRIEGLQVYDEGTAVGTGFTFSGLNFVGDGVTVTSTGIGTTATITIPGFSADAQENLYAGTSAGAASDADTCFNIGIGYSAGSSLNAGDNNVFLGRASGKSVTTGSYNTFFGWYAGAAQNSSQNVMIGTGPGKCAVVGTSNVFLGSYAGKCNSGSGAYNNFIGNNAGFCNQGSNNNFIGSNAGRRNTTGNDNVAIGCYAGCAGTTGCCNIAIGKGAAQCATGFQNTVLGSSAGRDLTGYSNVVIGHLTGVFSTGANCNVFLGAYSAQCTSGNDNVILGSQAGRYATTGCYNVFFGKCTASGAASNNVTGNHNIAMGCEAGLCLTSGTDNIFLGQEAGKKISGGDNNIGLGQHAGCAITSGCHNVFLGQDAGKGNTTGCYNIFFGKCTSAGGTVTGGCNVAMGRCAGYSLSSGCDNVFLGYDAGYNSADAGKNVFIGQQAGCTNTSGDSNVAIGCQVSLPSATGSCQLAIGNGSNRWITGDSNFNVGIGTNPSPSTKLDVNGTFNVSGISTFGDELHVGYQKEIYFANNSVYNAFQISQNGSTQSLIKNTVGSGNILIATGNAGSGYVQITNASGSETAAKFTPGGATELHYDGSKKLETTTGGVTVTGTATATDFNSTSDARLKTNVQVIDDPLEKVLQIDGVSFNWIENNKPSMGVIADNIQEVLPELVSDTDPKTVNYNGLIGLLIEVVKDQQTQINSLNERLSQLE